MSPEKRKYELKKRADDVAETHLRITEAAIELHGTVGPSRTTMSAVAKQAGVERRTLYRHFPTEADLFAACSAHYFGAHPFPEVTGDLEPALDGLYAYYERTEPMLANVLRDAETVDLARDAVAPFHAHLDELAAALVKTRGRRRLPGRVVRHALAFPTWRSLRDNGIERPDAVRLMAALVNSAG